MDEGWLITYYWDGCCYQGELGAFSIKQLHKAIIYSSEAWDYEICIEESSNSIQKLYMFDLNFDSKIERKSLNKLELINIALNIGREKKLNLINGVFLTNPKSQISDKEQLEIVGL